VRDLGRSHAELKQRLSEACLPGASNIPTGFLARFVALKGSNRMFLAGRVRGGEID
jgi:hypothetical protein